MQLDSLGFVYLFLPLSVGLFYALPGEWKKPSLMVISLLFYWLCQPFLLAVFFSSAVLDFILLTLLELHHDNPAIPKVCLMLSLGKSVAVLSYLYLSGQGEVGMLETLPPQALAPGLLVYSLNAAAYAIDCYRGDARCEESFVDYFLLTSFFGCLYVGPLSRHEQILPQLKNLRPSLTRVSRGVNLFVLGLFKKVILADNLLGLYGELYATPTLELGRIATWAMIVALTLGVFFLLSAYSDMARGLGFLFSIEYPRNLYYPYQAKTMVEFLERLHLTYYDFIRRYVQLPSRERLSSRERLPAKGEQFPIKEPPSTKERPQAGEEGRDRQVGNLLLTGVLMGLGFGLRWNPCLWGLLIGLLLAGEQFLYGRLLQKLPTPFRRLLTLGLVVLSFTLLGGRGLAQSGAFLWGMFFGPDTVSGEVLYLLGSKAILLGGGLVLCTSIFDLATVYLRGKLPRVASVFSVLVNTALLFITTAFML